MILACDVMPGVRPVVRERHTLKYTCIFKQIFIHENIHLQTKIQVVKKIFTIRDL